MTKWFLFVVVSFIVRLLRVFFMITGSPLPLLEYIFSYNVNLCLFCRFFVVALFIILYIFSKNSYWYNSGLFIYKNSFFVWYAVCTIIAMAS